MGQTKSFAKYFKSNNSNAFAALLLTLSVSFSAQADDIDIYNTSRTVPYVPSPLAGGIVPPNPNYPNVMLVLDASLSMRRVDSGQTGTRLQRLQEAMSTVLNNTTGVNVGIIRFSHRNSGGRVIYPLAPIEIARTELLDTINNLSIDYWTPTVGAMLESALYFRGESVLYGTSRTNELGHFRHSAEHLTRLSHPDSYTGGTVVREPGCTADNLDDLSCRNEHITGNPVYRTPILSECQANFQILVTDGGSTGRVDTVEAENLVNRACAVDGSNTCAVEIAEFLANTDQSSVPGINTVTTHTIGFNTRLEALREIAAAGNGQYFESSSANELAESLSQILASASVSNANLAQPTVTIDVTNPLEHRNDLYLSVFEPSNHAVWSGNLKGYWYDGELKDYSTPRIAAIDPTTGAIADNAHSQWSAVPDGAEVGQGGAASRIKAANSRNIVTNNPAGTKNLISADNRVNTSNIDAAALGLPDNNLSLTIDDYPSIMSWVSGVDVLDSNNNGNTTESRLEYGDPLHTNPNVVTYGLNGDTFDSVVFFGTNEGYLHAIETNTGEDLYSFIPWNLLENIKHSYANLPYSEKLYGLDGYLSNWFYDANNDGFVDSANDHYYLYGGMRRGGRDYYALDVTEKTSPRTLWTIEGGKGDFTELGQTWSKMVHGKMRHPATGIATDILVFTGGYDNNQDGTVNRGPDSMGRAIYIVDATTGELIWNAAPDNASLVLEDMQYSIPATPKVVDLDHDGLFDQLYVGDLGGQVWRFDVLADNSIQGGVIAKLSDDTTGRRSFFNTPDLSLVRTANSGKSLAISIGTGSRTEPLDTTQENAFYVLMQDTISNAPEEYGVQNNLGVYAPITHADLANVTDNSITEGTATEQNNKRTELAEKEGWYINLEGQGEKVLNPSITVNNKVVFSSYVPDHASACSVGVGSSNYYLLNILDGTPADNLNEEESKTTLTKSDRKSKLKTPGITPAPGIIFTADTVNTLIGNEKVGDLDLGPPRRAFWAEQPE